MTKGYKIHKNKFENWVQYILIFSGISILTTPIWKEYLDSFLDKYFGLVIPKLNLLTGWILLIIGLSIFVYFKSNLKKEKIKTHPKLDRPLDLLTSTYINRELNRERKKQISSFLEYSEDLLIKDQIKETGAWGYSQRKILNLVARTLSEKENQEGGIISTFIAIRALKHRQNLDNNDGAFQLALKYLLERQHYNGGFGRKYYSRSGSEIKPSYRHTALSLIQLLLLDGPPSKISEAVEYLKSYRINDITNDTSPSVAISSLLLTIELLINEPYSKYITENQKQDLVNKYNRDKHELMRFLESESKDITNKYSPYWTPYGNDKEMLYDTALTTIDFLSYLSRPPLDLIVKILNQLKIECLSMNGIPYNNSFKEPDIGMSIYFYILCNRQNIKSAIEGSACGVELLSFSNMTMDFAIDNYQTIEYSKCTYAETIGNALLLKI